MLAKMWESSWFCKINNLICQIKEMNTCIVSRSLLDFEGRNARVHSEDSPDDEK